MRNNEPCVAFCSPNTAREICLPEYVLVVSGLIPDDEVMVVARDEFLNWLYEREEEWQ